MIDEKIKRVHPWFWVEYHEQKQRERRRAICQRVASAAALAAIGALMAYVAVEWAVQ